MRSLTEIQNEYNANCAVAGSIAYKIKIINEDFKKTMDKLEKDLSDTQEKLRALNIEASEVKAKQDKETVVEAEAEIVPATAEEPQQGEVQ